MRPITKSPRLAMFAAFAGTIAATLLVATPAYANVLMNRYYNPYSGEHFYTSDVDVEGMNLYENGWKPEGLAWVAPDTSSTPVYRLYSGTDHHYTTDLNEKNVLEKIGWKYEGIGWYSDDNQDIPIYRQYNPYVDPTADRNNSGSHNYTSDKTENDHLVSVGWKEEGIAWYGVDRIGRRTDIFNDAKILCAEVGETIDMWEFTDLMMNRWGYNFTDFVTPALATGADWYHSTSVSSFKKLNQLRVANGLPELTWDENAYQLGLKQIESFANGGDPESTEGPDGYYQVVNSTFAGSVGDNYPAYPDPQTAKFNAFTLSDTVESGDYTTGAITFMYGKDAAGVTRFWGVLLLK
jgi:hypothetical protein